MSDLEAITYNHGDVALTGWLARPQGKPRAAILVFPTIANAGPSVKRRATMLADLGYIALIADFYGVTDGDYQALAQDLRAAVSHYRDRLTAALNALKALPEVRTGLPIATIGYCMGGQAALELAREGQDLIAAVSFHGILTTNSPALPGAVRARILVCHGDADSLAPRQDILAFWDEMNTAGAKWNFHAYSGVKHGFTDANSDLRGIPAIAYDASADHQSWAALNSLFDEILS